MARDKYKDLTKTTESDKVLRDKAFKIASSPKYNGYQRGLASIVFKFFDKMSASLADKSMALNLYQKSVLWTWLCNNLQM